MKIRAGRVARIRCGWFSDGLYDVVEKVVPPYLSSRAVDWVEKVAERPVVDRLLPRICAHDEAVPDCPDPRHDECRGCGKPMPGMAPRR